MRARKDDWLALGLDAKLTLLDQMIQDTLRAAEEWSAAGLRMRRVAPDAPAGGEEIATGPMQIVRHARCRPRPCGRSCTILAHPRTLKDPAGAAAVEGAIARLQYGTIGLNTWAGTVYGLASTTWGAFPGHTLDDIQSGRGVVHNTYLLEDPQKTVIRAPFRMGKKPPMAHDWQTFPSLTRRLLKLEASGDWTQVPGIVADGIRA